MLEQSSNLQLIDEVIEHAIILIDFDMDFLVALCCVYQQTCGFVELGCREQTIGKQTQQ